MIYTHTYVYVGFSANARAYIYDCSSPSGIRHRNCHNKMQMCIMS